MTKTKRQRRSNLIFLVIIVLLLIPQTRKPIQVVVNKGIAYFVKPSAIDQSERIQISNNDWALTDLNGNIINYTSLEGKVLFVNFWATWCPPCIAEMDSINALYEHYKTNDDVAFIIVSNEDVEVIRKFMASKNYSFPVLQSVNEYPPEFNVSSIPRTFIISPSGAIVVDKTGAANWDSEDVITIINDLFTGS
ncbi:TlpA disulfide reductase family protein [Psychroserpens sp.]|uniref:TlpA family protein disulfide reductase n=1 Tax=Psychroserpens sp. TaxID=2020870 RepID=UPI001B15E21B|nr:TlpA disulfide reductase family protein [Psychroserpens sp.]MBO6607233.1 TlpA family protein disulfide reductase [Psychroserpens sp.]MBO6630715.1 TlpA family protein disulfide reductase [Psychroserpens sp.]MBO6654379.1 TlpA family protein disulfide reductase [Psychroserpens sp.]MBO6682335.1 TlpA family protein disulfide reductase [Psychroserpens sp.]MBO6751005.1 TlpA family protein disulfide reductase [Psychroserpens sp.]